MVTMMCQNLGIIRFIISEMHILLRNIISIIWILIDLCQAEIL